jgi:hypothetical protein
MVEMELVDAGLVHFGVGALDGEIGLGAEEFEMIGGEDVGKEDVAFIFVLVELLGGDGEVCGCEISEGGHVLGSH